MNSSAKIEQSRNSYDLSHFSMTTGAIGGLQTLSVIPVVAGDSMSVNLQSVFRLSPLRRNLPADAIVDLFAFYVPHRHIYGSDWINFMKGGYDEAVTLGTYTVGASAGIYCIGQTFDVAGAVIPKWLIAGYSKIWNRYFKHPSSTDIADNYLLSTASEERNYGVSCCHRKALWNTGVAQNQVTTADTQYTVSGSVVELQDFDLLKSRLKTEIQRDWFTLRYTDLLSMSFGSQANTDADERPTLLWHDESWLSGYDVQGTDEATLGTYSGVANGKCGFSMPYKFFPEHGALWLMALVRFPPIAATERHYLTTRGEYTYAEFAGDPEIISASKPIDLTTADVFYDGSSTVMNKIPHSQWYRYHPSYVHISFKNALGHPFLRQAPASTSECYYLDNAMYDPVFASIQMKHWQAQTFIEIEALRVIPDVRNSIFSGT